MKIRFIPQRSDAPLAVSVESETITVNGLAFDLSPLADGATVGTVMFRATRESGAIVVEMPIPYSTSPEIDPMATIEMDVVGGDVSVPGHSSKQPAQINIAEIAWPANDLGKIKSAGVASVDADADAIYKAVLGNRGPEYERAERDAQAFQAAGFAGDVPPYVATWSSANSMTPQAAAEDILAQATAWNNAAIAIRQNRLSAKAAVRVAADAQEISAAMAGWSSFVAAIKTQLGA